MEAGRPADKIQVGFEILKILYKLNYSGFYFAYYHCNIVTVLELHFSQILYIKLILRCVLKCEKFGSHFFTSNFTTRY